MSNRVSPTSWGEHASLALTFHPSIDGVTMKIPDGVDILLHHGPLHLFLLGWLILNLNH